MKKLFQLRANFKKGSSLAEVVVASGIILVVMTGLYATHTFFITQSHVTAQKIKANLLVEEGIEAVKTMRDFGWSNISGLTNNTEYYLNFTNGRWATSTTPVVIDSTFYRTFRVENVSRAVNGDIVSSGGTLDTGTKKVTSTVSWSNHGATTTRSIATYIANIL